MPEGSVLLLRTDDPNRCVPCGNHYFPQGIVPELPPYGPFDLLGFAGADFTLDSWDSTAMEEQGLHPGLIGWLWGEGATWHDLRPDKTWQIILIGRDQLAWDHERRFTKRGKCRFGGRGEVVYSGNREGALSFLDACWPDELERIEWNFDPPSNPAVLIPNFGTPRSIGTPAQEIARTQRLIATAVSNGEAMSAWRKYDQLEEVDREAANARLRAAHDPSHPQRVLEELAAIEREKRAL